jgi:hypothetical protein
MSHGAGGECCADGTSVIPREDLTARSCSADILRACCVRCGAFARARRESWSVCIARPAGGYVRNDHASVPFPSSAARLPARARPAAGNMSLGGCARTGPSPSHTAATDLEFHLVRLVALSQAERGGQVAGHDVRPLDGAQDWLVDGPLVRQAAGFGFLGLTRVSMTGSEAAQGLPLASRPA